MAEGRASRKVCEICEEGSSKYCCPRCDILYCSVNCYKSEKHSECSESFYRDCVSEDLASYQTDNAAKQKMVEILKKLQGLGEQNLNGIIEQIDSTCDSDDEAASDLHERIQGLNLDDTDALWNVLTDDERNQFELMLSEGDVGSILPQWEPWWMYTKEKKLIQVVDEENVEEDMLQKCPELKEVPDFSTLTRKNPSRSISYNITNVLTSYAFVMRYFNGEISVPVEATVYLLDICSNLNANTNFVDIAIAVEDVAQKCLQSSLIETDEDSVNLMKSDTIRLLQGPSEENQSYYCKAALSHLYRILSEAKAAAKLPQPKLVPTKFSKKFPDHKTIDLPALDISKLRKCIKKVKYYLSYVGSR